MSSQYPLRADTREDGYSAARRGEGGKEEGFYPEENPALMNMIERAQQAQDAQREGLKEKPLSELAGGDGSTRLWYQVDGRGGVNVAMGQIGDGDKHVDEVVDDDLEALRVTRLQQMKARAAREEEWRRLGHGRHEELNGDAHFFEEAAKNDRMVCALVDPDMRVETALVKAHLERIAPVHLETKLCSLSRDKAPMLHMHVKMDELPVLFLMRGGKVTGTLPVDRSFTTEGLAYELSERGFIDSDETLSKTAERRAASSIRSDPSSGGPAWRERLTRLGAAHEEEEDDDLDD